MNIQQRSTQTDTLPGLYKLGKAYRTIQLIVVVALLLALVYGWRWLMDPADFPVKAVKIEATYTHLDQQALQAEIIPYVQQGFIRMDTAALIEQLLKFPWIATVEVQRIWPDKVIIKISEQQAVARWGSQGLLNAKGQIFSPPADTIPTDLPILQGPQDEGAALWANYQAIAETLKPFGLQVRELNMDDRQSLQLLLDNGTQILLGKTDPLPRLARFVKVYPKIVNVPNAQPEYIDLRYENGVSIKWKDAS